VVAALAGVPQDVRRVVGVDGRRGAAHGVQWRVVDVASPDVAGMLAGSDVVVHLACDTDLEAALAEDPVGRRQRTVRSAQAVLTAAAAVGAHHVVVVTSAMVYGAHPGSPVPLDEAAPLQAPPDAGLVGDLLEVERVVDAAHRAYPGTATTVLRPAALVGDGVDTVVTRHFEAPRLLTVREATMVWQFCHVDDLASAVVRVVVDGLAGGLTVGCEGVVTQASVELLSGMRRVELPSALAFGTAERLHRVGVLPMPAGDLSYVVHPWVVPSTRLREAGWRPAYDNETCLGVLLEQVHGRRAVAGRRVERKDAAMGAAGAAVALVGTAAAWRQARVRQARRRSGRG
jgi:nucleoside-diphosphate-sugar epimerase